VRPNAGIRMLYQRRLMALIDEMAASVRYWIRAQYRETPPRLAQDATPAKELEREMARLSKRWLDRFDELSGKMAKHFAKSVKNQSQATLRKALSDGGFSVKFTMTQPMRDVLDATIAENVGLIRSIPQQYLGEVQGLVMRSVTAGRDLSQLTRDLQKRYGVTSRRAAFIAIDQNNKATAAFTRVRQEELGLKAIWLHSHAGKEPRPTHVAMDGKTYDPAKGMYDKDPRVKAWIWPGQLPRCRCVSRSIVPGFS
jgi:SPP1 gp7 family putative phage head morphogenesis protein